MNDFIASIPRSSVPTVRDWLATRGGVACWQSIDISRAGQRAVTPLQDERGNPYPKPSWHYGNVATVITDPAKIGVYDEQLFRQVAVSLRRSSNGLSLKLTDASAKRLDAVMARCRDKHGNAHRVNSTMPDGRPAVSVLFTSSVIALSEVLK